VELVDRLAGHIENHTLLVLLRQRVGAQSAGAAGALAGSAEGGDPIVRQRVLVNVNHIELGLDLLGFNSQPQAVEEERPGTVARRAIRHQPPVERIAQHDVLAPGREADGGVGDVVPFHIQIIDNAVTLLEAGSGSILPGKRGFHPLPLLPAEAHVQAHVRHRYHRSPDALAETEVGLFVVDDRPQGERVIEILVAEPHVAAPVEPVGRILDFLDGLAPGAGAGAGAGVAAGGGVDAAGWVWDIADTAISRAAGIIRF